MGVTLAGIKNETLNLKEVLDAQGLRIVDAPVCRQVPDSMVCYKNAKKMAREIRPEKGMMIAAIFSGDFIMGDFIEAWVTTWGIKVKEMTISTLSMSQENADSLANLQKWGYLPKLNLILSDDFASKESKGFQGSRQHGRAKGQMMNYIYNALLRNETDFQLATASTHMKVVLIETEAGAKVVIHGSANLRTSSNIEQVFIQECPPLYDFFKAPCDRIVKKYATIKKSLRRNTLWAEVQPNQDS